MPSPSRVSNKWYYLLIAFFVITGCTGFVYTLWHGLDHLTDSLTQVVIPGQIDLSLQPGTYTIFYEQGSVMNGRIYSSSHSLPDLQCSVTEIASGKTIPIVAPSASANYQLGGRSGRSILQFQTFQSADFRLACQYLEQKREPEIVLAVGSRVGTGIITAVFASLGFLFFGFVGGGGVVLWMLIRHERQKKSTEQRVLPT